MRFYIGILSIITSIFILFIPLFLLDFSFLFEKLVAIILLTIAGLIMLAGINNLSIYSRQNNVLKSGLKTKARIIKVQRTLLAIKSAPNYILEIKYEHPKNHLKYQTFLDFYKDDLTNNFPKENQFIDIMIDPNNPDNVIYRQNH